MWGNVTPATAQAVGNPAQADQSHNHVRAILYLRGRGRLPQDDRPHSLRVRHNDWCDLRDQRGPCNCKPVILVDGVEQRVPDSVYRRRAHRRRL